MEYVFSFMAVALAVYYLNRISKSNGRVVRLIYFELIYNLIIKYLIGNLGLPSMLNYIADFVLVWIVLEFLHQSRSRSGTIPKVLKCSFMLLLISTIISYAANIYSPLLYLWGFRNNFRFIIYAMMCAAYLRKRDIETIMDILFGFFSLNIIIVTYQYFFVSYSTNAIGDFVSGLFSNGMKRGGNASLDWLMCIVCTYAIVKYLNKTGSLAKVVYCLVASMYMAALGEIKLFYVQIFIIGILAILICKKSLKVFVFTIVGVIGLVFGIRFLYYAFPKFADFFTYENVLNYITKEGGYSSRVYSSGIDRGTVFSYTFEHFLISTSERLFGVGLGNADFSSFSLFTSDFYRIHGWSGYTFFSSAIVTIELGIVGFAVYLYYFARYFFDALKKSFTRGKTIPKEEKSIIYTIIIISLMCFLMIFSNQTLKMETSAYMVNCVLSMLYILGKDDQSQKITC